MLILKSFSVLLAGIIFSICVKAQDESHSITANQCGEKLTATLYMKGIEPTSGIPLDSGKAITQSNSLFGTIYLTSANLDLPDPVTEPSIDISLSNSGTSTAAFLGLPNDLPSGVSSNLTRSISMQFIELWNGSLSSCRNPVKGDAVLSTCINTASGYVCGPLRIWCNSPNVSLLVDYC